MADSKWSAHHLGSLVSVNQFSGVNGCILSSRYSKGKRGTPLTDCQKCKNTERSKVRCRVEHMCGHIKGRMKLFIRTIGLVRAEKKIVLSSLAYNMARCGRIA